MFYRRVQEERTEDTKNLEERIGTSMKKIVIFGLSLTLALNIIGGLAIAQAPGPIRGYGIRPDIPDLTPEQITKIQALQRACLKRTQPLWQELVVRRKEIRDLWLNPSPDQIALRAKGKEILALQAKIQEEATNFRLEMRKILTAEQQAQIGAFGPRVKFPPGPRGRIGWGNPGPERMPEKD